MASPGTFELDGSGDRALSDSECRRLLATRTLGRVGLSRGALPVIMPVEYVYDAGVVTFRTEDDGKLRAAVDGAVLAFEVDSYDSVSGNGWSVHVLGRATVLVSEDEIAMLPTLDDERDEPRRHYVRLHCEIISGRRLSSSRQ